MADTVVEDVQKTLDEIKQAGLWKDERVLESPQGAAIRVRGQEVLNFCANNYLGLSNHPQVVAAARRALDEQGYGLSSVRFVGPLHLRHPGATQETGAGAGALPRQGGRHPLHLVFRCQWRPVRNPPGSRGRGHLRRAQPCEHHRWHPPVQGRAAALRQRRHVRPRETTAGQPRQPPPPDRHRWCVQHGRHRGTVAGHLRTGRPL